MSEKKEVKEKDLEKVNGGGFLDFIKKATTDNETVDAGSNANAIYGTPKETEE